MAKRGRRPFDDPAKKKVLLGVRVSSSLRDRLTAATKISGNTLAQEVENRLRLSFDNREQPFERFGGEKVYQLLRFLSVLLIAIGDQTKRSWRDDVYTFEAWQAAINETLRRRKPKGPAQAPEIETPAALGDPRIKDKTFSLQLPLDPSDFGKRTAERILAQLELIHRYSPFRPKFGRDDDLAASLAGLADELTESALPENLKYSPEVLLSESGAGVDQPISKFQPSTDRKGSRHRPAHRSAKRRKG